MPDSAPRNQNTVPTNTRKRTNNASNNAADNSVENENGSLNRNSVLTMDQNEAMIRLWESHNRVIVDAKLSSDLANSINESSNKDADGNHRAKKLRKLTPPFSSDSYDFMTRLYKFFYQFLEWNLHQNSKSPLTNTTNRNHLNLVQDDKKLSGDQTINSFLKPSSNSSLRSYSQLAFGSTKSRGPSGATIKKSYVRLIEGRHVITLHHEDFMTELNQFELQGSPVTDEFIRKHSFGQFLYFMPAAALSAIGCSMALAIVNLYKKQLQLDKHCQNDIISSRKTLKSIFEHYLDTTQIIVRFVHVYPQIQMMDIKTGLVNKFVSIKGHVVKVRPKRLRLATAEFLCQNCNNTVSHSFEDGKFSFPNRCIPTLGSDNATSNDPCRSKSFAFLRSTARYIEVQDIRLQEAQEENTMQAGRTPKQVDVELTHDLVNACRPGDIVLLAAIVTAINTAVAAGSKGKRAVQETSTYKLYLIGHSITTMSESLSTAARRRSSSKNELFYTQQQFRNIVQLCHADHRYFSLIEGRAFPFDLLVRSLCPSIIGHHEVKAGLLLCLLGGTPTSSTSSALIDKGNSIRSNSHVLIVGDPGMGKSQMLLAATQLASRSVYVGGNTSSTTGLTVTLTKEERGEAGIEAGALVLADRGICAIDEFDKMAKSNQDGLLEAMEQQQVSIAKAGVVASLPARCSVIAAANPKHGSYDMGRSVAENLNMSKPILSRFDLVFILRDRADKVHDRLVSSNIMSLYRNSTDIAGSTARQPALERKSGESNVISSMLTNHHDSNNRMPISERLAWVADFQKDPLPADLVRDYVAYAREHCKPQMTQEAAAVLKDYFMELRYPSDGKRKRDTVPITTRQLEALIRLCQARAKATLREYVLKEDALDVIELMAMSVKDVHCDESGRVDPCRGGAGGISKRKMKKAFLHELHQIVGTGCECSQDDLRRIADKVGCGSDEFQTTVDAMRDNGVLILKGNGKYKVLS